MDFNQLLLHNRITRHLCYLRREIQVNLILTLSLGSMETDQVIDIRHGAITGVSVMIKLQLLGCLYD